MKRTKDLRKNLMSFAVMFVLVAFTFIHLSLDVFAAEGKVTASSAKIRKEASTTSEAIGGATQGQTYTINSEINGSDGKVWYQITFEGNKTGYIRSDLMEKVGGETSGGTTVVPAPTAKVTDLQPVSAVITGSSVRVRSDASTEGSILASVVKDSVVTITGQAKDNQEKTWYRVTFSSDTGEVTGFIREDFLAVSGTITPVVDVPPVVDEPIVDIPEVIPETPEEPVITDDFYLVKEDGKWYLVDKEGGYQYGVESLIKAAQDDPKAFEELRGTIKSQKGWIIVLVIIVAALGVTATFLFLKVREVMDEAYFTAIEKETMRQRQGQKANNPSTAPKSKNVMHTVGATGNKTGSGNKTSVPKPANTRPVQQKTMGTGMPPQTVKVSNPEDTRAAKPVVQSRTDAEKVTKVKQEAAPVTTQKAVPNRVPAPEPKKESLPEAKPSWQSKNFVDDDDDFEFEFLNWDGSDDD